MPYRDAIPKNLDRWLESLIDSLGRDYSLSYVERLVKYYRYNGAPIQFRGYEWQLSLIQDFHPRQTIKKRSQVGVTTIFGLWKLCLFLEQYAFMPFFYVSDEGVEAAQFPTLIYTLEDALKASKFSSDRLKGFIKDNPYLEYLLEEGEVDQVELKKFGRAALYIGGRRTVSSVITIPAQVVMADEWDQNHTIGIGEQLESRLKASPMFRAKTQRGCLLNSQLQR
jgi:hypothetical protein